MKTPAEIKKALQCCAKPQYTVPCQGCPYDECGCGNAGKENFPADTLAYINQLEKQLDKQTEYTQARIDELETTILLMKLQMEGDCGCCKHQHDKGPCADCMGNPKRPHWEYEGLPELPKKGASS
jgi:hypothetical protein